MKTSDQINELAKALALAQAEIKGATRDSDNPYFKSKYADLASVWDACREALTKHGLSVAQGLGTERAEVSVTTMLLHSSGQWIQSTAFTTPKDMSPQSVGSATTYLRRYGLAAMVGVAPEDDDGEGAQHRNGRPAVAEIGRPDRVTEPATDAEVAEAFPPGLEAEMPDPRPAFRAGNLACPNCGRKVFKRKDGSRWFCWQPKGGCGMHWPETPDRVMGEVADPRDPEMVQLERDALLLKASKLAQALKLPAKDRLAAMQTYCGTTEADKADPAALRELVAWLETRVANEKVVL